MAAPLPASGVVARPVSARSATQTATSRTKRRLQLLAVCLAIAVLVFSQSSGFPAADTKLDLVVSPWRFLSQAVTMWDPTGGAGQLQNQAYGYLFPMGPFFLIGHLMHLPAWVVQRAWESAIVLAAFLGTVRLSRLLGVDGFWPRVVTGLVYAFAPRTLMELTTISSELMPMAAAPWMLIPLVRASVDGSMRKAAAKSGLALLFAGGVNAAATLAVLPIPALWLLTRGRGPRRWRLAGWWGLATVAGCLWWAVPLAVLGKYSPPFLNWIEPATSTTAPTTVLNSLRGTEHWEAYLGPSVWPIGWSFLSVRSVVLASGLVPVAGLAGLLRRRTPHRGFLVSLLLVGLLLLTFGHVSAIGPLVGAQEQRALDGVANAFRNIHKFDPLVRLPLALGVGHLAAWCARPWRNRQFWHRLPQASWRDSSRLIALGVGIATGVVALAPALTNQAVAQARSVNDPSYWSTAADWLGQHPGRALVVPAAPQPVYVWGSPRDDALQPLAKGPWTVRDSAPLAQPDYVRLLDQVETRLAAGQADPTLAPVLARSGIHYVVVRNDLETGPSAATPLPFVQTTLRDSPSFRQVAQFGPNTTPPTLDTGHLEDLGATRPSGSVTVYVDTAWRSMVSLVPTSDAVVSNGEADQLPDLTATGLQPDQPVLFGSAGRALGRQPTSYLTDGTRRTEFGFGEVDAESGTLTATQPFFNKRPVHDYLPSPPPALSTMHLLGVSDVLASSSGADANAFWNRNVANGPWSAFDDDPGTAWRIGAAGGAVGQWLQVDLDATSTATSASIAFAGVAPGLPDQIAVTTAAGRLVQKVRPTTQPQQIRLPAGPTGFVRVTILRVADRSPGITVGVSALGVPGVVAARTLDVPPAAGAPDVIAFTANDGARPACLTIDGHPGCNAAWQVRGEEDDVLDRTFTLSASTTDTLATHLLPAPGQALDALLDHHNPVHATASSTDSDDPRERPGAAVDGSGSTAWEAAKGDLAPTLRLRFRRSRISGVQLLPAAGGISRDPVEVVVNAGGVRRDVNLGPDGIVRLGRSVTTRHVRIHVVRATLRSTTDTSTGVRSFLPVGIGEVHLLGRHAVQGTVRRTVTLGCRSGAAVQLDGRTIPLRLRAPEPLLLLGAPLLATPCGQGSTVSLATGQHRLSLTRTPVLTPVSVQLTKIRAVPQTVTAASYPTPQQWDATSRRVPVVTGEQSLLVVHENANAGWRASIDGRVLRPIVVDGWQQGWIVPAGTAGMVQLTFTPQRTVDVGFVAGAYAVVLLLLGALVPVFRRRRTPRPPLRDAVLPWQVIAAFGALLMLLLGGATGLAAAVVAITAARVVPRRHMAIAGRAVAVALLLAMTLLVTWHPPGSGSALSGSSWLQAGCLVALALLLGDCLRPRGPSQRV